MKALHMDSQYSYVLSMCNVEFSCGLWKRINCIAWIKVKSALNYLALAGRSASHILRLLSTRGMAFNITSCRWVFLLRWFMSWEITASYYISYTNWTDRKTKHRIRELIFLSWYYSLIIRIRRKKSYYYKEDKNNTGRKRKSSMEEILNWLFCSHTAPPAPTPTLYE